MQTKSNYFIIFMLCFLLVGSVNAAETKDATINNINVNETKSIEIIWDPLYFTYNKVNSYNWNEKTHKYDEVINQNWENNGKSISIKNKSFLPINIDFKYTNLSKNNIGATFSKNHLHIDKKQSDKVKLYLNGQLNENSSDFKKIGVVTVSVT